MSLVRMMGVRLRPYRLQVSLVLALIIGQTVLGLYLPNLTADIINNGIAKGDVSYIWSTGALMLALTLASGTLAVVATYFASRISMGVGRDLRGAVFGRVLNFSAREMNSFGTASLITRNTNDVQQIQLFLQMALTIMVAAPIMMVGGVIMALHENVSLSLLLVVAVPLMAAVVLTMLFLAVPQFQSMQVKIDRINQVLREQITGVRVIRAFVRSSYEEDRFASANASLTATGLRVNRLFVIAFPVLMGVMNLSSVAVIWFGGHLVATGQMPIGNLTAFLAYILQILMSVLMAVIMVILVPVPRPAPSASGRCCEWSPGSPRPRIPWRRQVPGDRGVRQRPSLAIPAGSSRCCATSPFASSPARRPPSSAARGRQEYPPQPDSPLLRCDHGSGTARRDGRRRATAGAALVEHRARPQQAYLFGGTVADNLRFGDEEASEADLWHALEVAQASDFVSACQESWRP